MSCPNEEQMAEYALGKLPADSHETVAAHIETCADCQTTLAALNNAEDTLVARLRQAAVAQKIPEEPSFCAAVTQAAQLIGRPAEPPPESPSPTVNVPSVDELTTPGAPGVKPPQKAGMLRQTSQPAGQPMAQSLEQLSKSLIAAGLVSADELKTILNGLPAPVEPPALAARLVELGKLTKFQAQFAAKAKPGRWSLASTSCSTRSAPAAWARSTRPSTAAWSASSRLKVLPPAATKSPDSVKRFHREVKAAAKLDASQYRHRAYDAGEANGQHFLVMEFVEGGDLSGRVKERRAAAGRRSDCVHAASRPRPGTRTRQRHHPSRHQAIEPAAGQRRRRQNPRHGPGPNRQPAGRGRRRRRADHHRQHHGHGRLHVARAGHGHQARRPAGRYLLARLHAVLPAHRLRSCTTPTR